MGLEPNWLSHLRGYRWRPRYLSQTGPQSWPTRAYMGASRPHARLEPMHVSHVSIHIYIHICMHLCCVPVLCTSAGDHVLCDVGLPALRTASICDHRCSDDIQTFAGLFGFGGRPGFWSAGSAALQALEPPCQPPPRKTGVAAGPLVPPEFV